ncbi:MAG: class I tRNA ligase family protein, partial [Spirochaetales bacterium]|nr:class I tRNA ligase family protein [Spirochaetales bacterium]
ERVFFTGMVMDLKGRKMSKSLGNGIDPFEVIDRHGADALRYTMIAIVSPNQNLKLGFPKEGDTTTLDSFEIGSRFANKIWNAARFILMNVDDRFVQSDIQNIKTKDIFDRWILDELNHLTKRINNCMEKARFNDVALELQHFFWDMYCDWYLEIIKGRIFSTDQGVKNEALSVALYVLTQFLKLLHPVMPFITEEIYQKLPAHGLSIMTEDYPEYNSKMNYAKDKAKTYKFFETVRLIRQIRGENNIPPEKKAPIIIKTSDADLTAFAKEYGAQMMSLSKGASLTVAADAAKPADAASSANQFCEVYIPLDGIVDKEKERARLEKEYAKVKADFDKTNAKLNNANFTAKAPAEIIEKEKAKLEEFQQKMNSLAVMLGK